MIYRSTYLYPSKIDGTRAFSTSAEAEKFDRHLAIDILVASGADQLAEVLGQGQPGLRAAILVLAEIIRDQPEDASDV